MDSEQTISQFIPIIILLASGIIAVPIFKKLKLGSVLGYFCSGLIIGPHVLTIFNDPEAILHIAELGIVMFLFIIGLEMRPSKLWEMRKMIFGLGIAQVSICSALLTLIGVYFFAFSLEIAFIAACGFVLSSTAVVMQMLSERNEKNNPAGQRAVSILLLEDLAIVPLLAIVTLISPQADKSIDWVEISIAVSAVVMLVVAGRWMLNPFFAILASTRTPELMTAGALLVVLGSAFLMEASGLSMAMGAFLSGVLLSGSSYRHQLEVDIAPFKGLLLGLFFLAVGMSLDLSVVFSQWPIVLSLVFSYMSVKAIGIFATAKLFKTSTQENIMRTALFAQGGEFAFVLYAAATSSGLLDVETNSILTATIIFSMAITPLVVNMVNKYLSKQPTSSEGLDMAKELDGEVLLIGFGRFGQLVSQSLLMQGIKVSIIDNNPTRIKDAKKFGHHIYFGDGTNLEILNTSGAKDARAILVCVDKPEAATHIIELINANFPHAKVLVRAWDRRHAIELISKNVEQPIRETAETAFYFGQKALELLGIEQEAAISITEKVRKLDDELLKLQAIEGLKPSVGGGLRLTEPQRLVDDNK